MEQLVKNTLDFTKEHDLLRPHETVVLAFSGGPDSVALALVLKEISSSCDLPFSLHLAHLNHCLRGKESEADEEFCRRFAGQAGFQIEVGRADVKGEAARRGQSLEHAARSVRYAFLVGAALRVGAAKIATAHHADDVAETVLLRIIRGSGVRGLAAFAPRRPAGPRHPEISIVRPFLKVSKQDILDFLAARGQGFCTDSSNVQGRFMRNRIRHELIPLLERDYEVFSVRSLCALNDAAVEIAGLLEELLDSKWPRLCVEQRPDRITFDAGALAGLSAAERKEAVRRALAGLNRSDEPAFLSAGHYNRAAGLAEAPVGSQVSLPQQVVARREHGLVCFFRPHRCSPIVPRPLPVPGAVKVEEAGITITSELLEAASVAPQQAVRRAGQWEVFLSLDALALPLAVRGRQPGDRFRALGAPGSKKLKDFFIDHKVPLHVRDETPLVVTARDEIAWVVGAAIGHPFRLQGTASKVLHLRAEVDASR